MHKLPVDNPTRWGLTLKQFKFTQYLFEGSTKIAAFEKAGYSVKDRDSAYANASQLSKSPKVLAYYSHLSSIANRSARAATLSRQAKREILADIAYDGEDGHRLQAIAIDNRMTGDDAPVRLEGEITLGAVLAQVESSTGLPGRLAASNGLGQSSASGLPARPGQARPGPALPLK